MCTPMITVPAWHPVRSASGSFFYNSMANKASRSIRDQIELLRQFGIKKCPKKIGSLAIIL